ncbi:MAG: HD domain-containing protein [Planctomycetota bacterium]|nr:HD domain-containing protein [Planctomycetota bacterium]MEC9158238.1 HD domain-containing protein [Planctomycetota bacterium]MED6306821.1 HD domain-containing protein [Planctomycetota bacterium]
MSLSPDQARTLMHEWVEGPSLRNHMESVACCTAAYARLVEPAEVDRWEVAALLHDLDYERHPTIEEHPFVAVEYLRQRGDVDDEILNAILAHADYSGVPRETPMAHHLYACDELAGFIVACSRVIPAGVADLKLKSVRKKFRNAKFAAAVNRDDVTRGAAEIGADLDDHIQFCIDALVADRERLGI